MIKVKIIYTGNFKDKEKLCSAFFNEYKWQMKFFFRKLALIELTNMS